MEPSFPEVSVQPFFFFIACPFRTLETAAMVAGIVANSETIICSHDSVICHVISPSVRFLVLRFLLRELFSLFCATLLCLLRSVLFLP